MDSTGLRTRLTHAARRLPPTACALRLASARIPQVTSTILPCPPLVTILPPPLPCAVSPNRSPLHSASAPNSRLLLFACGSQLRILHFALSTFDFPLSSV